MYKIFAVVFVVALTGCTTTHTRTASVCDVDTTKFWFIPLTKQESCVAVSGGSSDGQLLPVTVQPVPQ